MTTETSDMSHCSSGRAAHPNHRTCGAPKFTPQETGIRIPRMHARPPMIWGSKVIRSNMLRYLLFLSWCGQHIASSRRFSSLCLGYNADKAFASRQKSGSRSCSARSNAVKAVLETLHKSPFSTNLSFLQTVRSGKDRFSPPKSNVPAPFGSFAYSPMQAKP